MADLSRLANGTQGMKVVYYSDLASLSAGQTHTITPAQDQYVLLYVKSGSPAIISGGNTIHDAADNEWLNYLHGIKASELPPLLMGRGETVTVTDPAAPFYCFYALLENE